MMKCKSSPLNPSSILFVYSTSGRKSLARDVHSVLFRGVSLTVLPVLSLVADLSAKVRQKASQGRGRVISIHLDDIQNATDAGKIIESVEVLPNNTQNGDVI